MVQAIMLIPVNHYFVISLMLINGITTSVNSQIVLLWIAELCELKYRGILGVIYEIAIGCGNVFNALTLLLVNYLHIYKGVNIYTINFTPALITAVLCLVCQIPIPDKVDTVKVEVLNDVEIEIL